MSPTHSLLIGSLEPTVAHVVYSDNSVALLTCGSSRVATINHGLNTRCRILWCHLWPDYMCQADRREFNVRDTVRRNMPVTCNQKPHDPMRRVRHPILHAKWPLGVLDELLAMYAIQQSGQHKLQHAVLYGEPTPRARYCPTRRSNSRLSSPADVLAVYNLDVEFVRVVFLVSAAQSTLHANLHSSELARRLVLQVFVRCDPCKRVCRPGRHGWRHVSTRQWSTCVHGNASLADYVRCLSRVLLFGRTRLVFHRGTVPASSDFVRGLWQFITQIETFRRDWLDDSVRLFNSVDHSHSLSLCGAGGGNSWHVCQLANIVTAISTRHRCTKQLAECERFERALAH